MSVSLFFSNALTGTPRETYAAAGPCQKGASNFDT